MLGYSYFFFLCQSLKNIFFFCLFVFLRSEIFYNQRGLVTDTLRMNVEEALDIVVYILNNLQVLFKGYINQIDFCSWFHGTRFTNKNKIQRRDHEFLNNKYISRLKSECCNIYTRRNCVKYTVKVLSIFFQDFLLS